MTENFAEKRDVRRYAREHEVSYREARSVLRDATNRYSEHAHRLLIEAVEGCGITHWSSVQYWDGQTRATIVDLGGEQFDLDVNRVATGLGGYFADHTEVAPLDVDSYLADEIVQTMLFGGVIYRSQIRRRVAVA
ncbi:hypothetical protein [Gordonia sp. CPCC 205333]|uniref:hypothetical protein n=1 Tax=Gordonia sp. CPCC 205333 TaxID=3140790 RepID=UPI003AF3F189